MNDKRMKVLAALCMASFLAACGGGGDDNNPPPPPPPPAPSPTPPPPPPPPPPAPAPIASVQGLLTNTSPRGVVEYTLVVPGGEIFHVSNPGFVPENGRAMSVDLLGRLSRNTNGQLQGTMVRYNTADSAALASLQGTVNNQGTIAVSITPTSTQLGPVPPPYSFTASPVTDAATFNFNRAATLAELGGNYEAPAADYQFSINDTTGAISGRALVSNAAPGCAFTGTATPQATNFYRVNFTYGTTAGQACDLFSLRGITYSGVAFVTRTRTNTRELHMVLFNAVGTQSFSFTSVPRAQ